MKNEEQILEIATLEYLLYIKLRDDSQNYYLHDWYDAKAIALIKFMEKLGYKWDDDCQCFL